MGSRLICIVRWSSAIGLNTQKRYRTKWINRIPVRIVSESTSEVQNKLEDKLNIERQILKRGQLSSAQEVSVDLGQAKSSDVTARCLHEEKLNETSFIRNKSKFSQRAVKERKFLQPDPFGLSSLMPEDGSETDKFPENNLPLYPVVSEKNSSVSSSINDTICDSPDRTQPKVSDIDEMPIRRKIEQKKLNISTPQFIKHKEGDEKLRKIMLLTKSKKMREKHNLVAVEGKRLIKDFIDAGAIPKMIFFSRVQNIDNLCVPANLTELYKVTYKQLSLWTDVETSQGVIGLFEMSQVLKQTPVGDPLPITVICDNVRDPGNMGSVLRIAAGAGCEKIILTKGCVDLWDSKVLRSAAGAHCRLPIMHDLTWEEVPEHLPEGCVTFAADNSPLENGVTPLVHYDRANFSYAPHVALVVGGETHGLSPSALALASVRLHVPLNPCIDSLNSSVAFAIIVFEARRHLTAGS